MPPSKNNAPEHYTTPTRRQGSERRLRLIEQALAVYEEDQRNLPPPPTPPLPTQTRDYAALNATGPRGPPPGAVFNGTVGTLPSPYRVPGSEQRRRDIEQAFIALGYGPEPGGPTHKIVIRSAVTATSAPRRNPTVIPATGSRGNPVVIAPTPTPGSSRNPIEISATPTPGSRRNPIEIPATPIESPVPGTPAEIPATPRVTRPAGRTFTPLFLSPTPSPVATAATLDLDPFVVVVQTTPRRSAVGANRQDRASSEVPGEAEAKHRKHRTVGVQTEKADPENPENNGKHRAVGVQADMDVQVFCVPSTPEANHSTPSAPSSTSSTPPSSSNSISKTGRKRPADQGSASGSPSNRRRTEWHTPPSRMGSPFPACREHDSSQADSIGYLGDSSASSLSDSPGVSVRPIPPRIRHQFNTSVERTTGLRVVVVSSEEEMSDSNPRSISASGRNEPRVVVISSEESHNSSPGTISPTL